MRKMMVRGILHLMQLLLYYDRIAQAIGSCTRPPVITSYSRPYEALMLSQIYNLTWRSVTCNSAGVVQYQIQITGGCTTGSTQPLTIITGNNKTTALLVIPQSCDMSCYLRIRAEMSDSSYTDYSACIIINNQLMEHERGIKEYYGAVCVPIQGVCSSGFRPMFFINSRLILWSQPDGTLYNISYSTSSQSFSFCFNNITEDLVLTEFCHFTHTAGCSLCSVDSGEVEFLSYSEISMVLPTVLNDTITYPSTVNKSINLQSDLSHQNTVTPFLMNTHPPRSTDSENNLPLLTIVGAASIGAVCSLIVMVVLIFMIAIWCRKGVNIPCSVKSNTGNNTYDEPSLPDPIYQELEDKNKPDAIMKMVKNDSYGQVLKSNSEEVSVLN